MYANVLKFHICNPDVKIGDPYFFLIRIISHFRVTAILITLKSRLQDISKSI